MNNNGLTYASLGSTFIGIVLGGNGHYVFAIIFLLIGMLLLEIVKQNERRDGGNTNEE